MRFTPRRLLPHLLLPGLLVMLVMASPFARAAHAQLNWDGQTGLIFTPTAAVATTASGTPSRLTAGFRVLGGGEVLGTHFQSSLTTAPTARVEFGYSRASVASEADAAPGAPSTLFDRGFNVLHGKVLLVNPASAARIHTQAAVGGLARWQQQHLPGARGVATQHGEVYGAATHTFLATRPWCLNTTGGVRLTNGALFGLAGNAPDWRLRLFGSAALARTSVAAIGAEWVQQNREVDGYAGSSVPDTASLFVRMTPASGVVTVDLAIVRLGRTIAPNVTIDASTRIMFGVGVRY